MPPLPPLPALAALGLAHLNHMLLDAAGDDDVVSRADVDRRVTALLAAWRGAEARLLREGFDRLDTLDAAPGARVTRADFDKLAQDLRAHLAQVDPFGNGLDRPEAQAQLTPVASAVLAVGALLRAGLLASPALRVQVGEVGDAEPDIAALFYAVGITLALDEHWARRASYAAGDGDSNGDGSSDAGDSDARDVYMATQVYRGITGTPPPVPLAAGWPSRVFAWMERTFAAGGDDARHADRQGAYDSLIERLVADNRGHEIQIFVASGPWAWPDDGAQALFLLPHAGTAYLWTLAV